MSLTSKQIDELRAYAKDRKGKLAKLINDAADTIEMLSKKLHTSQMERSSQYYHGGWIPVSERLPEESEDVLLQFADCMGVGFFENGIWAVNTGDGIFSEIGEFEQKPIAWMPLPSAYQEEGD